MKDPNIEASGLENDTTLKSKKQTHLKAEWKGGGGAWPRSFGERTRQASHERKKKSPDSRSVLALAEGDSPAPSFAEMPDSEAKSMSWMHRYAAML